MSSPSLQGMRGQIAQSKYNTYCDKTIIKNDLNPFTPKLKKDIFPTFLRDNVFGEVVKTGHMIISCLSN